MNEKKYVRVQAETSIRGYFSGDHAKDYVPNFDGDLKVVPADAIVIERGALPEVRDDGSVLVESNGPNGNYTYYLDAHEDGYAAALAHIALHEHRTEHPPVDAALVEALASDLSAEGLLTEGFTTIARRLVEQGWTKPAVES